MNLDLTGRVAVITGASSGIGEATARTFAAHGAAVVLLARRGDRIQAIQQELADAGHSALAIEADVTDAASLQRAVVGARELGRVDLLVNNAGVMLLSPFDAGLIGEWRQMIDTNVTGVLMTTNAFLDDLTDGGGDIVNISAVAGRQSRPSSSVYNASKWAVNGWSDALRQELIEKDVRVGLVEPGATATELASHVSHEATQEMMKQRFSSMERLKAEDVADAVLYMASRPVYAAINEILMRPSKQDQ
jgi:NADP-dependent 3-hydroxy acid dehydrogenase YdfG